MTDDWDPSIPMHRELARGIEQGDGIPEMRTIQQAKKAMQTVGFELEHSEDLAERGDQIPWYYPLEGDLSKAQTAWDLLTVWRIHWTGRLVTRNAMRAMEFVRFIPQGTCDVAEQLETALKYLVQGGQTKVFSPSSEGFYYHVLNGYFH
jgi:sterol 24-C-methyltransferase